MMANTDVVQLCTGKMIDNNTWPNVEELLTRGREPPKPSTDECIVSTLSLPLWEMMKACWTGPPDERPDASLLRDYLAAYDYSEDEEDPIGRGRVLQGTFVSLIRRSKVCCPTACYRCDVNR
jgi:hypothetical protein